MFIGNRTMDRLRSESAKAALLGPEFLDKYGLKKEAMGIWLARNPNITMTWDLILGEYLDGKSIESQCVFFGLDLGWVKKEIANDLKTINNIAENEKRRKEEQEECKRREKERQKRKFTNKKLEELFGFTWGELWLVRDYQSSSFQDFFHFCEHGNEEKISTLAQVPDLQLRRAKSILKRIEQRRKVVAYNHAKQLEIKNRTPEQRAVLIAEDKEARRVIREQKMLEKDIWRICKQIALIKLIQNQDHEFLQEPILVV